MTSKGDLKDLKILLQVLVVSPMCSIDERAFSLHEKNMQWLTTNNN